MIELKEQNFLEKTIKEIKEQIDNPTVFVTPDIPDKISQKVLKEFGACMRKDQLLAVCDAGMSLTAFAKNAIADKTGNDITCAVRIGDIKEVKPVMGMLMADITLNEENQIKNVAKSHAESWVKLIAAIQRNLEENPDEKIEVEWAHINSEGQAMKDCPRCGEKILAVAEVCKHCKSKLTPSGCNTACGTIILILALLVALFGIGIGN